MPTRLLVALVAALTLLLTASACGGAGGGAASAPSAKAIEISETDFALAPATVRVGKAGTVTLRAVNNGGTTHALEIEGAGVEGKTSEIAPGQRAELTVELKPGEYKLYCPVGNHRSLGMTGKLVVAGAGYGYG